MNVYRPIIFLLLCLSVLFSSCNKEVSDLEKQDPNSGSFGYFFPNLIPNLRNYPFAVRMAEIEEEPQGHRVPSRSFSCTVSREEIIIEGVEKEEILSYEVYDKTGVCVGLFSNEQDFISFIFSVNGFYTVCFLTKDCCFAGSAELSESNCHETNEGSLNSDKVLKFKLIRINYVSN